MLNSRHLCHLAVAVVITVASAARVSGLASFSSLDMDTTNLPDRSNSVPRDESDNKPDPALTIQTPGSDRFVPFQPIPTMAAVAWEYFSINNQSFLAVAEFCASQQIGPKNWTSFCDLNSTIYRFNGTEFVAIQSIPTHGAFAWTHFTIGSTDYLAVANLMSGTFDTPARVNHSWPALPLDVDSQIFQFDGKMFQSFQKIPTHGIHRWEHFTINNDHFLAGAYSGNTTNQVINSQIFKFDGKVFTLFQEIQTFTASDWRHFTMTGQDYLVVANFNAEHESNFNINSTVYLFDGTRFVPYQNLLTHGAFQ